MAPALLNLGTATSMLTRRDSVEEGSSGDDWSMYFEYIPGAFEISGMRTATRKCEVSIGGGVLPGGCTGEGVADEGVMPS